LEDKERPRSDGGRRTYSEDGRADAAPVWASTDGGLCMQQPLQAAAVSGEPRMGAEEATA